MLPPSTAMSLLQVTSLSLYLDAFDWNGWLQNSFDAFVTEDMSSAHKALNIQQPLKDWIHD